MEGFFLFPRDVSNVREAQIQNIGSFHDRTNAQWNKGNVISRNMENFTYRQQEPCNTAQDNAEIESALNYVNQNLFEASHQNRRASNKERFLLNIIIIIIIIFFK